MSKLFFDHLVVLEGVEAEIKKRSSSKEERVELEKIVDEITIHKVLEKVLDNLPPDHYEEFLGLFHKCPHDEVAIFGYLNDKAGKNIEEKLKEDLKDLDREILKELRPDDEASRETKVPKK